MATELLPCPFCGTSATIVVGLNSQYGVFHDGCVFACTIRYLFKSREEAIKSWNTRHVQTVPVASNANKPFVVVREDNQHRTKPFSYFVLDVDKDPHATEAMKAYVVSLVQEQPRLAELLYALAGNRNVFEAVVRYGLQDSKELSA